MLEKMFTTKMSMDKKKLQNRFSKIRSKNGKTSKFIALAVFAVIIVLIICVSTWVAVNRQDDTAVNSDIKLTFNGEIISFQNDPYIFSETLPTGFKNQTMVYFPLEELCQKLGVECEINGNKAVIKVSNVDYEIEVGKNQIFYDMNGEGFQPINFAPEIKNYTIYIPYEFVKYIWIDANEYDISGSILYKNETMNVQFEIPMQWLGKYIADETKVNDDYITFKHKRIAEKHNGMGMFFSVMKMPDSEIDDYMNMVPNQTVMWRNQDYGYLIGRPSDVQVPIFVGNDEEDIKLAEEYSKMYKDVSYIESTFSLIKDIDTHNIVNAENLSYAQIKDLQRQVDNGHFPWRLDYEQVVQSFLSGKGIDVEDGEITELAGGADGISLTYSASGKEYSIELFKPIDITEQGIWIVKSFKKKGNAIIEEVHFYERTPAQAMIEKQEDGWYKVPQHIKVFFQYDGETPSSVVAYFTQTGTEMEQYKKEIGKITAPYTFQTMAQVLSIDVNFSKEDMRGHLWFVFEYDNGKKIYTDYFNVYRKAISDPAYEPATNEVVTNSTPNKPVINETMANSTLKEGVTITEIGCEDIEETNYIYDVFNYDNYDRKNNMTISKKDGTISFYYKSNEKQNISIKLVEAETGNVDAEYVVVPESNKIYNFNGLKDDNLYEIVLEREDDENIDEPVYIVYQKQE